jgi:hypothetical protein
VDHFLAQPYNDLAEYVITPREWEVLEDFEAILSVRRNKIHVSIFLMIL